MHLLQAAVAKEGRRVTADRLLQASQTFDSPNTAIPAVNASTDATVSMVLLQYGCLACSHIVEDVDLPVLKLADVSEAPHRPTYNPGFVVPVVRVRFPPSVETMLLKRMRWDGVHQARDCALAACWSCVCVCDVHVCCGWPAARPHTAGVR